MAENPGAPTSTQQSLFMASGWIIFFQHLVEFYGWAELGEAKSTNQNASHIILDHSIWKFLRPDPFGLGSEWKVCILKSIGTRRSNRHNLRGFRNLKVRKTQKSPKKSPGFAIVVVVIT